MQRRPPECCVTATKTSASRLVSRQAVDVLNLTWCCQQHVYPHLFPVLSSLAVVPQGGNTGLVGGSIPVFDEVVVSLARMNKIISINEASGTYVGEGGGSAVVGAEKSGVEGMRDTWWVGLCA